MTAALRSRLQGSLDILDLGEALTRVAGDLAEAGTEIAVTGRSIIGSGLPPTEFEEAQTRRAILRAYEAIEAIKGISKALANIEANEVWP